MKSVKMKSILCLLITSFIFQGCNKDEDLTDGVNDLVTPVGNDDNPTSSDNLSLTDNDLVFQWTQLLLELERYAIGMRPNASARALAYIYLAAYETAVPAMSGYVSTDQRFQELRIQDNEREDEINFELALNKCFSEVLDHFLLNLPNQHNNRIRAFERSMEDDLSEGLSDRLVSDSEDWGEYIAEQIIAYSQTDDAAEAQVLEPQPLSYEPPGGDGFWTYSADPERALFPYWGRVRTFIVSPEETTTVAPKTYSENQNSPYFAEMQEVYTLNNEAKNGDDEQLWIAEFWSDDVENLMFSPPARQFAIANQLIKQYDLNMTETLDLYIKLGFSLNDAAVSTWKYKYEYMVMRPSVFIHEFIDPNYQTNLFRLVFWPNPGFPGYPSGHSCFASAAGGVFSNAFGNQTNFTDRSHEGRTEFQSAPRTFNSFAEMAEENAFSRIPLGVHIRMDCVEGLRLGYEISDAINGLDLRANSVLATVEN